MALVPFTLTATPGGSTLRVGDTVIDNAEVTVTTDPNGVPTVTVTAPASGTVEGQGIVKVMVEPTEADILTALAGWLETIDPAQLAAMVDQRLVSLSQHPVTETVKVLAELAREATRG